MTVAPEITDVQAIVEQVWSSFLGEDEPLLPSLVAPGRPFGADDAWSAAVSISGGWDATVTVELSTPLALSLTGTMLGLTEAEPIEDGDVADAVGELVNMIGGNIKSLMPGPSVLSLPAVAAGRAAHPSGAAEVARFDGVWAGQPVRVAVHVIPQP
jgi:CheY-specific phosphatase CheX